MKSKPKPPPGPYSCREETPPSPWVVTIRCLITDSDHSPAKWMEGNLLEHLTMCDNCGNSPILDVTAERLVPEKKED
tara:strand:- start:382 stop:612 length:231 start_codon:yes stop_codon:yes gene_type:complete